MGECYIQFTNYFAAKERYEFVYSYINYIKKLDPIIKLEFFDKNLNQKVLRNLFLIYTKLNNIDKLTFLFFNSYELLNNNKDKKYYLNLVLIY